MERSRFSQTMASEWQTAFVVSHKMPCCACSLPSRITTKVLKNCKTFSSRPRPRPNVQDQDQDQDFHFFLVEEPRDQDPDLEPRGLHHCASYRSRHQKLHGDGSQSLARWKAWKYTSET